MLNNPLKLIAISCVFVFTLISHCYAQHQQKTHLHGTSNLTIAIQNSVLQIELNAPLMDIVGFENKPRTENQKQSLKLAREILKDSKRLFTFNGSSCKEKKVLMSTGLKNTEHDHENHHTKNNDTHNDINIFYEFNCTNSINLTVIDVHLFDKFPKVRKINSQWVTVNGQGQEVLDKTQNQVSIR
jgi:hypothetical protein